MSDDRLDWAEKYRPRSLREVVGSPAAIARLQSWANSWSKGKPQKKGAVLIGRPGIGKTSSALALAADYGWDLIELNASDQRNASAIMKIVGHGSRADSFSADGSFGSSSEGRRKLIVFDEADNLFGREDYGGAKAIVRVLRESAQPIILIVNDYYELTRRASGIKQLTQAIRFSKPTIQQVMALLTAVASYEGVSVSRRVIENIARNSNGDIRAAMNDLQSVSMLGQEQMEQLSDSLGWRDSPPEIFAALETILTSDDPLASRQSVISLDETPDRFIIWLEESASRVIRDPYDRYRAFEFLSDADIFLGRVYRRQYYRFWSYATDLMSMGVSQVSDGKYRIYSDSLRFPSYLASMGRTKSERDTLASLLRKVAAYTHTSSSTARESVVPYLRSLMMRHKGLAVEMTRELSLLPGELSFLLGVKSDSKKVERIMMTAQAEQVTEVSDDLEESELEEGPSDGSVHQRSLFDFR